MKKRLLQFCLLVAVMSLMPLHAGVRIVVLGSSTAAGTGVQDASNAWVNRYQAYLQTLDPTNQVINLAKGGYTTCAIMPTGTPDYNTGSNILSVDTERNIDKALSYEPGAIIINMPTNDVSNGIPVDTQMEHFKTVIDMAEAAGVKVWITTSQPHNFGEDYDGPYGDGKEPDVWKQTARDQFKELTEKILETYGERAIDFYTDIATEDGYSFIRPEYDSGDGVHLNDAAHAVLFEKVKEKNILSQIDSESFGGVLANPVYVNFGPIESSTKSNWNYVNGQSTGFSVSPLIDYAGISTTLSVTLVNGFTHAAENGVASSIMEMDDKISMSNFSSNSEEAPVVRFAGLSPNQVYDFSVFASRSASDNRECIYTFAGSNEVEVALDAASNTQNLALAKAVAPAADGTVTLTITRGVGNTSGFCYLNAMKITSSTPPVEVPEGAIMVETAGTLASLLTQPVGEITELVLYGSLNGTDIKTIMEMTALEDLDMENARIVAGGDAYLNGMKTRDNVFPQEMFVNNTVIKRVILPAGITELLYHTFMGASSLETVQMPDGVVSFGNDLFSGCSSLTSINISAGLKEMGSGCFYNCKLLTSLTIPEGVTVIPGGSFYGCAALVELNLPETITRIEGDWTFSGCNALSKIVLGPNVESLPGGAFYNCWSLNTIYCMMSELPAIDTKNGETPFTGAFKPEYCTLYVPFTAYSKYKNDEKVWGVMSSIQSLETIVADGETLLPENGTDALLRAKAVKVEGSMPDAAAISAVLAQNENVTSIDLTGVTGYLQRLEAGNPNCLTFVPAEAEMEGSNIVKVSDEGASASSVVLEDGYDFNNPLAFVAESVSYARDFEAGWSTIALPFAYAVQDENVEEFNSIEANSVVFSKITSTELAANKAYLIYIDAEGEKTFTGENVAMPATAVEEGTPFVANFVGFTMVQDDNLYKLSDDGTAFDHSDGNALVGAFRAYLDLNGYSADNTPKKIVHRNEDPTNLEMEQTGMNQITYRQGTLHVVVEAPQVLRIYAVDGRMVQFVRLQAGENDIHISLKGLYIINNQKFIF